MTQFSKHALAFTAIAITNFCNSTCFIPDYVTEENIIMTIGTCTDTHILVNQSLQYYDG